MAKYRIVQIGPKAYKVQKRILGFLWCNVVSGGFANSTITFGTIEETEQQINAWKQEDFYKGKVIKVFD